MKLIFGLSLRQRCQPPEILNLETFSFALHLPLPPSPPTDKLTQPLNYDREWLRTLYEVLREMNTIKIHFRHCNEEILNLCLNTTKNVPETVQ